MRAAITLSIAAACAFVVAALGRWVGSRTEQALAGLSIPLPPIL